MSPLLIQLVIVTGPEAPIRFLTSSCEVAIELLQRVHAMTASDPTPRLSPEAIEELRAWYQRDSVS